MDKALEKQFGELAESYDFAAIVKAIDDIPEGEWDREMLGWYVRSLNNNGWSTEAIEVSLRYRERDGDDPLWNYRLGYAYWDQDRYDEALDALQRAKEFAAGAQPVTEWVDELLDDIRRRVLGAAEHRAMYMKAKAATEARRRAEYVPRDPSKEPFEGFDFTDFWDDREYALENHVGAPPTDERFAEVEKELGYKLPESYKRLMRSRNGGIPRRTVFRIDGVSDMEPGEVYINSIFGVDGSKRFSLTGELGSRFMIDKWKYPDIGIAVCNTISGGHDMVFLDYRACGPQGEPEVVWVDQESDYEITWLAGDFESFIRGLAEEEGRRRRGRRRK